jgi:predicted enzyme related to lactoylglutathione lyase
MFKDTHAFSSFSVDDIAAAKKFYGETLGLDATEMSMGLNIKIAAGGDIFIYPKNDHSPASFTVLNFPVPDIDSAVDQLKAKGVTFESFGGDLATDDKGILRSDDPSHGPSIAWFKDPAGNFISILQRTS